MVSSIKKSLCLSPLLLAIFFLAIDRAYSVNYRVCSTPAAKNFPNLCGGSSGGTHTPVTTNPPAAVVNTHIPDPPGETGVTIVDPVIPDPPVVDPVDPLPPIETVKVPVDPLPPTETVNVPVIPDPPVVDPVDPLPPIETVKVPVDPLPPTETVKVPVIPDPPVVDPVDPLPPIETVKVPVDPLPPTETVNVPVIPDPPVVDPVDPLPPIETVKVPVNPDPPGETWVMHPGVHPVIPVKNESGRKTRLTTGAIQGATGKISNQNFVGKNQIHLHVQTSDGKSNTKFIPPKPGRNFVDGYRAYFVDSNGKVENCILSGLGRRKVTNHNGSEWIVGHSESIHFKSSTTAHLPSNHGRKSALCICSVSKHIRD